MHAIIGILSNPTLDSFLIVLAETLALLVFVLITVAYLTYAERKVLAAIQIRKGADQRRGTLPVCDQQPGGLRHHHRRLGEQFEVSVHGRAAQCGADD